MATDAQTAPKKGLSSWKGILGIILLAVGIIAAIIGTILMISDHKKASGIPWYDYFLLIGGVILAVIGGIMMAFALKRKPVEVREEHETRTMVAN